MDISKGYKITIFILVLFILISSIDNSVVFARKRRPDLKVKSISGLPENKELSESFSITINVKNRGDKKSDISILQYYFSSDTSYSTDDILVGSYTVPVLKRKETLSVATIVTIPDSIPLGNYYLIACADDTKIIKERNEENNCAASPSTIEVLLPNQIPIADFTGPVSALTGNVVSFDASSSYDSDGSIASYSLDFGDGGPVVNQPTPIFSHSYTNSGMYNIVLTVTDDKGLSNSLSREITIGLVFSTPVNVSNTVTASSAPRFFIDEKGNINVIWQENANVMFSRSTDGGNSFIAPEFITTRDIYYSFSQMEIASSISDIHISWTIFPTSGGAEILYSKSTDGGATYSNPLLISDIGGANSYASTIATNNNGLVGIVWHDDDVHDTDSPSGIMFSRSDDNGNNFYPPQLISEAPSLGCPRIAISSQNIYVSYLQAASGEIFFLRSIDGGLSFSSPINISQTPDQSWCPVVMHTDSRGNIYVIWDEGSPFLSNYKILFSKSTDEGLTFSTPLIISSGNSICPSIAVNNSGQIFITWSSGEIYVSMQSFLVFSDDEGATFSTPLKIPVIGNEDACPEIVSNGINQIGIIWSGPLTLPKDDYILPDIYYSGGQVSIP